MSTRNTEDVSVQSDRLVKARLGLTYALDEAARLAKHTSRYFGDINEFYAAVNAVRRAEEELDLAELDLHTARGGDA